MRAGCPPPTICAVSWIACAADPSPRRRGPRLASQRSLRCPIAAVLSAPPLHGVAPCNSRVGARSTWICGPLSALRSTLLRWEANSWVHQDADRFHWRWWRWAPWSPQAAPTGRLSTGWRAIPHFTRTIRRAPTPTCASGFAAAIPTFASGAVGGAAAGCPMTAVCIARVWFLGRAMVGGTSTTAATRTGATAFARSTVAAGTDTGAIIVAAVTTVTGTIGTGADVVGVVTGERRRLVWRPRPAPQRRAVCPAPPWRAGGATGSRGDRRYTPSKPTSKVVAKPCPCSLRSSSSCSPPCQNSPSSRFVTERGPRWA